MMVADLLTHVDSAETASGTLTESQAWELRNGVRAAIEHGEESLSLPSRALSADRWHHWGIGVSVWLHDSGVVVLQKNGNTIVTDITMLEHVSQVLAGAHARIGPITRVDPDGREG
ncbi:hypothetical protein [Saliphagus infecundisoli]|uniref:Uncharacterized protein n=1 Tax=Saliphagus infecundisoli TaxID=1849069 RepID=A0ABD5Q993_9EURY|nr:hypothetical protein [Saliphagus infecundisoli]